MTEDQFTRFVDYVESRFQQLATKADWDRLAADVQALRMEMRERFEIVHDRLAALERGSEDVRYVMAQIREQLNDLSARINELNARMDRHEALAHETNRRLIDLREEMQQRLRVMNERLAALEQRIAA